jgi:class 3 adenylate cyclase
MQPNTLYALSGGVNIVLGGIVVHIGARIAALAAPDEVLVSSTVKDLVAGSGLSFRDRGAKTLKGVPNEWHLYSAEH